MKTILAFAKIRNKSLICSQKPLFARVAGGMATVMMQTWMDGPLEDLQEVLLMVFVGTLGNNSIKLLTFVIYKLFNPNQCLGTTTSSWAFKKCFPEIKQ